MLLLSVYLTKSSKYFAKDFTFLLKYRNFFKIYNFFKTVLNYLGELLKIEYRSEELEDMLKKAIVNANKKNIATNNESVKREFWIFPNIYLMLYFTLIFLVSEI